MALSLVSLELPARQHQRYAPGRQLPLSLQHEWAFFSTFPIQSKSSILHQLSSPWILNHTLLGDPHSQTAHPTFTPCSAERPELHALSELHGTMVEASQDLLDVFDTAVLVPRPHSPLEK